MQSYDADLAVLGLIVRRTVSAPTADGDRTASLSASQPRARYRERPSSAATTGRVDKFGLTVIYLRKT